MMNLAKCAFIIRGLFEPTNVVSSCALLLPFSVYSYLPKTVYCYLPITKGQQSINGLADHWGLNAQESTFLNSNGYSDFFIGGFKVGCRIR